MDELQLLRAARPAVPELTDTQLAGGATRLAAHIRAGEGVIAQAHADASVGVGVGAGAGDRGPAEGRARWRRRWLAPLAVAGVVAAAAAGYATLGPATNSESLSCEDTSAYGSLDGSDPVATCQSIRAQQGLPPTPLVACVDRAAGSLVVVPGAGAEACASHPRGNLMLWVPDPSAVAVSGAVRSARIDLHDRAKATGNSCATPADWQSRIDAQLQRAGVGGWTYDVVQHQRDRRCYEVSEVNPVTKVITLFGVPGDHSIGCDPRVGC